MEILTQAGGEMLSRWAHYLAGVTWIGLLYYFNFVQAPALAAFEAGPRTEATAKLVPRALWWFRYGALLTFLSGISILSFQEQEPLGDTIDEYWGTELGTAILTGAILATIMFLNVWGIIWPKQKVVIASAQRVAAGGEADPNAAGAARRALLASRTNTFFSIPMLFFMGAASHLAGIRYSTADGVLAYWIIFAVIVAFFEANALGLIGGPGPGPTKKFLENHRTTIIAGFALWIVFIALWEIFFQP